MLVVCPIVAGHQVNLVEAELVSDLLSPLADESFLGGLGLSEDTCLLLEGIVLVLVDEVTLSGVSHAVVDEVRNELVHLPGM